MNTYRSTQTIQAVQFVGEPIEGVTCSGTREEVEKHGCDSSRKHLLHVHTQAVGGMTILKKGDWIYAVHGGPWAVKDDATFRSYWEVVPGAPAIPSGPVNPQSGVAGSNPHVIGGEPTPVNVPGTPVGTEPIHSGISVNVTGSTPPPPPPPALKPNPPAKTGSAIPPEFED